jgi:hypothetical protein
LPDCRRRGTTPNIAGERRGIAKAARLTQLSDQARGGPRSDAINSGQESANFVSLKLTVDILVELLYSISQELYIRTHIFD